jgi:hypothetical protein
MADGGRMEKNIEFLKKLIDVIGNVTLSEAATWLEVEENAERLRAEGHEADAE